MSDTANSSGGAAYQSQTTKALSSISESPGPDLSDGEQQFVSMLSRHDYQIKFLADNQQALQVGVNQATSNPIQQVQQFIADLQVLMSGAALPKGALDYGDLQYELPAIGALLGFGTGGPVNLFEAAEHFFFGYVVPNQQYTDLQIAGFNSWAQALGIDPQFVKDMDSMTQAFGDLFDGLQNLGPSLASLFDELGITGTDLGPLGQLLAPILQWFKPIDFSKFGSMIEWLTDAIEPWITSTTKTVDFINALIAAIGAGGDVVNSPLPDVTRPFGNLIRLFATLDLSDPQFQTIDGWNQLFGSLFVNLTEFDQGVWAALGGATSIPISAITNSQPNLLNNGDFEGAISMSLSDDWSWDSQTYYSSDGIPGSATVTADGHSHALRSGPKPIRLGPGQTLNLSVRVLTSGFVSTGTPLRLDVVTFLSGTQVAVESVDYFAAPFDDPSDWINPPSGSKTVFLHGVYTTPTDGSVDSLLVRLGVDATATAGQVWFDDTVAALTGGLLADLQDDVTKGATAFTALWNAWSLAVQNYTDWPTFSAAFNSALQTYVTTMSGIQADEQATIQQLLNSLIPGLFPSNSDTPSGILDLRSEQQAGVDAWQAMTASWTATLSNGSLDWSTKLAQMEAAFATYQQAAQQVASDEVITITSIIDGMFGIDPSTGLTPTSQVAGLSDTWTQIGAAVAGDADDAGDWSWLANIMTQWFGVSSTAHNTSVDNANTLAIQNNKPLIYGLDNTTEANIPFTPSPDLISVAANSRLVTFIRCQQASVKNTAAFVASAASPGSLTSFGINVYKVDFTAQTLTLISSTDLASQVGTTAKWMFPSAGAVSVQPGDTLAVLFHPVGTTVTLYGSASVNSMPAHPTAILPALAADSTASGSPIAFSALTFHNSNIPYVGLETSSPPPASYPDKTFNFTTAATTTQTLDAWVKHVDLIGVGGGGGGEGELGGATGYGGTGGSWATTTLVVGVDIKAGSTLHVTVGAGGVGGPYFTAGANGQATTITYTKPDNTTGTFTAAGGFGGNHTLGLSHNTLGQGLAPSPQSITYLGTQYVGGAAQFLNSPGNPPGGGGEGGQPFQYGTDGARGQAWIVERQS